MFRTHCLAKAVTAPWPALAPLCLALAIAPIQAQTPPEKAGPASTTTPHAETPPAQPVSLQGGLQLPPSIILPPPTPEKPSRVAADLGIAGQKRVPTIVVAVFLVLVLAVVRGYTDRKKQR